MEQDRLLPPSYRGLVMGLASVLLAVALVLATVAVQRPDPAYCRGLLGAGYPASFVCDASGESPLSSVGRIDWADTDSINLPGSCLDVLFYGLLLWGGGKVIQTRTPSMTGQAKDQERALTIRPNREH